MIIFDDILTTKDQSIPSMMFTKGRHNNCAVFYLSQSFYDVKKLIRKNANTFILFDTNDRNLKELVQSINVGNVQDFKEKCREAWADEFGYILINLDNPLKKDILLIFSPKNGKRF